MKFHPSFSAVLAFALVACGPSAEDEKNMEEKMKFENERSEIMTGALPDCDKLETELTAYNEKNRDGLKRIDAWWVALGDGAKDALIEKHRAAWDQQSKAVMSGAMSCGDAYKKAMKAAL
ncbi:MAG: hypothetical protein AAGN82_08860 [Myxococcota bacterium]